VTASIERQSPLAGWRERLAAASASPAAFSIRELAFTTQVNFRGNSTDPAFAAAVRESIGCELPREANAYTTGTNGSVLWLGPDEWLVVDRPDRADAIAAALRAALSGKRHSVTDVSAARTVVEIGGADARLVLAKGCPLDLHASAFRPPRTAQTLLAKSRVLIQCMDDAPRVRLFVLDSFAAYLAAWLVDAAAECAAARAAGIEDVGERLT
jgi:sarcosine oxidase subunit gamma